MKTLQVMSSIEAVSILMAEEGRPWSLSLLNSTIILKVSSWAIGRGSIGFCTEGDWLMAFEYGPNKLLVGVGVGAFSSFGVGPCSVMITGECCPRKDVGDGGTRSTAERG